MFFSDFFRGVVQTRPNPLLLPQRQGGGGICTNKGSYCEKEKKSGGDRVDVNGEVKLL